MVDRQARDTLAEALRHLVSGQITNDSFDDRILVSRDRAVTAVSGIAWTLYSDLHTHRLSDRRRIPREGRETIARWILFLYSDLEYEWPEYNFIQIVNWPMKVLTLGWWERRKKRKFVQFASAGEWDVWPFIRRADFERMQQTPRLLGRD